MVDPDPFRNRIRDLIDQKASKSDIPWRDDEALESVRTVTLLVSCLHRLGAFREEERLLDAAYKRYPDDFEINFQLGTLSQNKRSADFNKAIRHHSACLAIQPKNPGVIVNLAMSQTTEAVP